MENIHDTAYDFTLVLRQMYTEAILRDRLAEFGDVYRRGVRCTDFTVDDSAPLNGHGVTSTFTDGKTGKAFKIRRQDYLYGAPHPCLIFLADGVVASTLSAPTAVTVL